MDRSKNADTYHVDLKSPAWLIRRRCNEGRNVTEHWWLYETWKNKAIPLIKQFVNEFLIDESECN